MLLHELHDTKVCNSMLFPESDEDIWKHEDLTMSVSPLGVHITKGDSKGSVAQILFAVLKADIRHRDTIP